MPKPKYVSQDIISQIKIPYTFSEWHGKDINIDYVKYKLPDKTLIRQYINTKGGNLFLIIYEGKSVHNPQLCFTNSGFSVRELDYTNFTVSGRKIKAITFYSDKPEEQILTIYWISMDKEIISNWVQHRIKQYLSLLKKRRIELLIRLDIPTGKDKINNAIILAKQFIQDLSQELSPQEVDYLFGKLNSSSTVSGI
jgi:hypothetical protein